MNEKIRIPLKLADVLAPVFTSILDPTNGVMIKPHLLIENWYMLYVPVTVPDEFEPDGMSLNPVLSVLNGLSGNLRAETVLSTQYVLVTPPKSWGNLVHGLVMLAEEANRVNQAAE